MIATTTKLTQKNTEHSQQSKKLIALNLFKSDQKMMCERRRGKRVREKEKRNRVDLVVKL